MRSGTSRRAGRLLALLAVCAATALSACGGTDGGTTGAARDTLVVDLSGYPASLDPGLQYDINSYSVYRNIFDQLLRRDPKTREVIPWIATEWERVNPTTWTFTLRDDIKFSDGSPLTAADAAYSIERILDPSFGSQQIANFAAIKTARGKGNDLRIVTKYPSPTLLTYLTTLSIVPRAIVEKVGDGAFNQEPAGSGPYLFESAIPGSKIVLRRNPEYWGAAPQIESVTFRSVPAIASRLADLKSGKAQLVTALAPDSAKQIEGTPDLQVLSTPTERVNLLQFNTVNGGPTNDVTVRRAISMAIDYDALIEQIQQGYGRRVNTVLTPLSEGYPEQLPGYPHDPEQAKQLIEQAGAQGKTIVILTTPVYDTTIVQAIQADVEAIGLKVRVQSTDLATFLKKVQSQSRDWGSIRFGLWSCSCLDADGVAYPLFRSGTVWSAYSNPEFDALVDDARQTIDPATRDELYARAYGILNEDVAGIGMFQVYDIYGASAQLEWTPDAQQSFFVAEMRFRG